MPTSTQPSPSHACVLVVPPLLQGASIPRPGKQQSRRARSRSTPRSMFVWRWNSHLCVLALSRAGGCWQQPALRRMAGAAVSFQPRPRRCGRWRQWRHRLTRWHVPAVCRSVCQNLCGATRVLAAIFVCSLSPDFCCAQWPRFPFKGSIDGSRVWIASVCVFVCVLCLPCAKRCANFSHTSPHGHTHQCTLPLQSLPCQPSQSVITVSKLIHNEGSSF
jgi:hypothetical protein